MRLSPWAASQLTAGAPDGWEVCIYRLGFKLAASGTNLVSDETLTAIAQAEGYFGYGVPVALLQAAPVLRWAHRESAGVGASITSALRRSGVIFTNSAGVYGEPMADTVLAGVRHFVRRVDFAVRQQAAVTRDRQPFIRHLVNDRSDVRSDDRSDVRAPVELRVLSVGSGGICSAVALRVTALECHCVCIRRRPELGAPEGLASVVGVGELDAAPPDADVIISAAPLTERSVSLPGARRLPLLPAGAIVVNVARGALVLNEAPLDALNRNHLRGAVLDVLITEP